MNLSPRFIEMFWYKVVFTWFYFFLVVIYAFENCNDDRKRNIKGSARSTAIQDIMKKVANITLRSLNKAPAQKKYLILKRIESRLNATAKTMGYGAYGYIRFIMDELKAKAFGKKRVVRNRKDTVNKNKHNIQKPKGNSNIHLRSDDVDDEKFVKHTVIDPAIRTQLIKDISHKVQEMAKRLIKDSSSTKKKKEVMEQIKRKILDTANKKHKEIHYQHDELKAYSSLIEKGVEISMQQIIPDAARRMKSDDHAKKNDKEESEAHINQEGEVDPFMYDGNSSISNDEIKKFEGLIKHALNNTPGHDPECDKVIEETCDDIQSFNKIYCGDGKTTPIENLCNGIIDCANKIDEVNCTEQATENVKKATALIAEIESSHKNKCFETILNGENVLSTQNKVLRDVLQTQVDFINKYSESPIKEKEKKAFDDIFIKKAVSDMGTVLSTLSYALDGTLCAHRVDVDNVDGRKNMDLDEEDGVLDTTPKPEWTPASCICEKQYCQFTHCEAPCKRVCWQRYSLNHWGCQAIHGGTSISLDAICDGKLDCFDETDELHCTPGTQIAKFQAGALYSDLLEFVTSKSKSYEFVASRNKLAEFHGLVRSLQKHTMKSTPEVHIIKPIRNEAFDILLSIYDELTETASMIEVDTIHLTLLKMNEQLVAALKRSHTGNDNIISSDGCYCKGGLCVLRKCNRNCVQSCLAQPVLTRFSCLDNTSISIDNICNGKENCANGEDEKHCQTEICRGHHLVLLRRSLQNVAAKYKETVLGDVMESWKNKVSAVLVIAENGDRPNHRTMVELIDKVLHDLVTAYAAMEDYKRVRTENTLEDFKSISKIVMNSLKSCRN